MTNVHPEAFCEWCGRPNVTWFAPSLLWNRVVRKDGEQGDPMLCPVCFIIAAEADGVDAAAWEVRPGEINGRSPT